jgi:hypothetical protein
VNLLQKSSKIIVITQFNLSSTKITLWFFLMYQLLYGEKPSVTHLRVFGCGAYVFLPAEVRANKLAPKSELMTYLGNAPGAGGFVFMRSPNNVLFYSTHCIFDEFMFPKCPKLLKQPNTRLQIDAPPSHHHKEDTIHVDEEDAPWQKITIRQKERRGKTLFHLKLRNRQLKTQYRRNKYHLLSEGLPPRRHLSDLDGHRELGRYPINLGIFMVIATL